MSQVQLTGKVTGRETVETMLGNITPKAQSAMLGWLNMERRNFIGVKGRDGIVRRTLNNKLTWNTGKAWRTQVVNLFNGKIIDPITGGMVTRKRMTAGTFSGVRGGGAGAGITGKGISMTLQMGVLYRNRKKIHEALEALENPHTVTSAKYMPIPVKGLGLAKAKENFKYWMSRGMFTVVYKNGLAFYFLNKPGQPNDRKDLKFVGRKQVNIRFSHRFTDMFTREQPGMLTRGAAAFEKGMKEVPNG